MKLKFKISLVFCLLMLLQNCEAPLVDNARLLIKGEVLDENNQPISNAAVSVYVRKNANVWIGGSGQLLGESQSKADGTFSVITLLGRDENFVVEVSVNNEYTTYQYRTSTEIFTPTDYLIDLGTVPIERKAQFNLNITRTSPPDTELEYTFFYKNEICREVYIDEELDEEATFCFNTESFGDTLNNNNPEVSTSVPSFVGAEVLFTYTINGQAQESQTIIIDQPDYEFNFNY